MKQLIKEFFKDESGGNVIEYGLIAGFVSVAAVSLLSAMGLDLSSILGGVSTDLQSAAAGIKR